MRKLPVVILFCLCFLAAHSQKWRSGQPPPHARPGVPYPIKIHVSAIHIRGEFDNPGEAGSIVFADAVMDGKKSRCYSV